MISNWQNRLCATRSDYWEDQQTMLVLFPGSRHCPGMPPVPSPPRPVLFHVTSPFVFHLSSRSEPFSSNTANINSTFPGVSMCLLPKCHPWGHLVTFEVHFFVRFVFSPTLKSYCPNDIEKPFKISTFALVHPAWCRAPQSGGCSSPFPVGASGKEPTCQCRKRKRHGFNPWIGKIQPFLVSNKPVSIYLFTVRVLPTSAPLCLFDVSRW